MEALTPDLLRLSGTGPASVHLVLADVPTLVDAGAPGRGPAIERQLRGLGVQPGRLVLTHGDPDHIGGLEHLRRAFGLETCAGAAERRLIDRTDWSGLPMVRRLIMRTYLRGVPPPRIDRWLEDGEDLDGLRVIATPGHTTGHLAYGWQGWILAGDAVVSGERCRESLGIFTIDRERARRSIERLAALGAWGVSSSHGPPASADGLQRLVANWALNRESRSPSDG